MIFANEIQRRVPRLLRGLGQATIRLAFGFAIGHSSAAIAAVADAGPGGFTLHETAEIAASPDKVYAALIAPAQWWSSTHTFSGSASNLTLDPHAGGCWCETLPNGGSVQHLVVVNVAPGKVLRLRGALGPFQSMAVDGALTFAMKPSATGTTLTLDYTLGGYSKDGFADFSKGADGVLAEQVVRLKSYVETGSPDAAKAQ
jgi:uncharacterized protein YndB with AHSA1/START domain